MPRPEEDEEYIASIEALSWLQQEDGRERSVGDSSERLTPEDTLRIVQELYAAGANEVLAERIQVDDEIESGDCFKVMLPRDSEARAKLFELEARVLEETGSAFDAEGERGQAFFTLGW